MNMVTIDLKTLENLISMANAHAHYRLKGKPRLQAEKILCEARKVVLGAERESQVAAPTK